LGPEKQQNRINRLVVSLVRVTKKVDGEYFMKHFVNFLYLFCFIVGTVLPAKAADTSKWYVDLNGGLGTRNNSVDEYGEAFYNNGYIVGAAIGYRFDKFQNFRTELNYNRQVNEVDKLHTHTKLNAENAYGDAITDSIQQVFYYDFAMNDLVSISEFWQKIRPYVGVGLGFNRAILEKLAGDSWGGHSLSTTTEWSFSYSFRGGVVYDTSLPLSVYIGGYYLRCSDIVVEVPSGYGLNQAAHPSIETTGAVVGIRYYF
jgi:opacity protein-like surface antigen